VKPHGETGGSSDVTARERDMSAKHLVKSPLVSSVLFPYLTLFIDLGNTWKPYALMQDGDIEVMGEELRFFCLEFNGRTVVGLAPHQLYICKGVRELEKFESHYVKHQIIKFPRLHHSRFLIGKRKTRRASHKIRCKH
jgi:hypothetical protein